MKLDENTKRALWFPSLNKVILIKKKKKRNNPKDTLIRSGQIKEERPVKGTEKGQSVM